VNIDTFSTLYEEHWRKVYALAIKHLANIEKANNVTNEAFFQLWIRKDHIDTADAINILLTAVSNEILKLRKTECIYIEKLPGIFFENMPLPGAN